MKKTIYLIIFFASYLSAQTNNPYQVGIPNMIPPSPTSRLLQKFTGYPISHATGTINITIPLFNLTYSELALPLELKYHSSGITVLDPIGVVGRNWAFFPGFKISRTIKGKPDETYPVKYQPNPSIEDQMRLSTPYLNPDCAANGTIETRMDGQHDIFQIHMPNIDGSFIINNTNGIDTVELISKKPWKITPLTDVVENYVTKKLYGFEIIDNQGIKYLFGEPAPIRGGTNYIETNPVGSAFFYITGWMLREIIFPDNSKISFTYQSIREDINNSDASITVLDNGIDVPSPNGCPAETYLPYGYQSALGSAGYNVSENLYSRNTTHYSLLPISIVSPNAEIALAYNSGKLGSVIVSDKNKNEIKTIELSYNGNNDLLTNIKLSGEGDYQLKYYDDNADFGRLDYGFDWWGYRNIKNGNYSSIMLPNIDLNIKATPSNDVLQQFVVNIGKRANREPNEIYIKSWSLEKIIYPTGGTFKINYEPHRFKAYRYNVGTKDEFGAGLRVKSTEAYDPVSDKTLIKSYLYEDAHYTGTFYPDEKCLITTRYLCSFSVPGGVAASRHRQRTLSVFSSHPFFTENPIYVWYGKVTEEINDHKTVYIYNYKTDLYSTNNTDKYAYDNHYIPEYYTSSVYKLIYPSPWLTSEVHYKKTANEYTEQQITKYEYSTYSYGYKQRNMILPFQYNIQGGSICDFMEWDRNCISWKNYSKYGSPVNSYLYNIQIGNQVLSSTTKITYNSNDSIKELVSYKYDSDRPYNITQKETLLGENEKVIEKYYYTNNTIPHASLLSLAQRNTISQMIAANYQTSIIEQTLEKSGRITHGNLYGYNKILERFYKPETLYSYEGQFKPRLQYHKYDKFGNLLHISKDDANNIVYLWSYNGQYPIAEIKNATYSQAETAAKSAFGVTDLDALSEKSSITSIQLNNLRNHESLKDAHVTTYTYKPLVGMLSATDPSGITTFYDYDIFGRLKETYIMENNVKKTIQSYDYHYQNQ